MTREPLKHRPLWIAEGDLAVTGPPDDYTDQLRRAAHNAEWKAIAKAADVAAKGKAA
jgi:hypothetical protein